jgi:hypothetical protein
VGLVVAIVEGSGAAIALLAVALVLLSAAAGVLLGFMSAAMYELTDAEGIGAAAHRRARAS